MYIEFDNFNDRVRDFIVENLFRDFDNDYECEEVLGILNKIKENKIDLYKKIIGVMCCDFCDMHLFCNNLYEELDNSEIEFVEEYCNKEKIEFDDSNDEEESDEEDTELEEYNESIINIAKELIHFKNIDEVIKYVEKDESILIEFIESTRDIHSMFHDEKRGVYFVELSEQKNLNSIYPLHFLDILSYSRPLTKEDLIIIQRDYYENIDEIEDERKTEQDSYDQSINHVISELLGVYAEDCYNYRDLMIDIISDYYEYVKFAIYNNLNIKKEIDKKLLKSIETSSINQIINETIRDRTKLFEIVKYFIEYNHKTNGQKKAIVKNIRKNRVEDIKIKILSKKDK